MKYGPIIYDPRSKEASDLIGKNVIGSNFYYAIDNFAGPLTKSGVLTNIFIDESNPFMLDEKAVKACTFIREVIEEEPKYRPYKDCEEMVEDYRERFYLRSDNFSMPLVWVKGKISGSTILVEGYDNCMAFLSYEGKFYLEEIFDHYTYLDGTPVGKEEVSE